MKKKRPTVQFVERQHPAALAAESDLVKLTREFEALKQQLFENDNAINEFREAQSSVRAEFEQAMKSHEDGVATLQRQRRILEAQFTNVTELLRPLIETERACNGCIEQPVNRFR